MKFCLNLSTFFQEKPLLERFKEAKKYGFTDVEIQYPYHCQPDDIARHLSGTKCQVMNSLYEGESFGYASILGRELEFCGTLPKMISYFNALHCDKINIMVGCKQPNFTEEDQLNALVSSLDYCSEFFDEYNLSALIEPICPKVIDNYFLSSFDIAVKALERTQNTNVKLLLDIYHLHKITGDVKENLKKYYPYAGHIQISQEPDRREPFYPNGEIDYKFVLDFLKSQDYKGFIGLEYYPSGNPEDSFNSLKEYM